MNKPLGFGIGMLLVSVLLTGAPAGAGETKANACDRTDYECMRDLMFFDARAFGFDPAMARRSLEISKKFWAQALEADELARDYQYQLPHNAY